MRILDKERNPSDFIFIVKSPLTFRLEDAEQFADLVLREGGHRAVRVRQLLRARLLPRGHGEHLRRRQAGLPRPQVHVACRREEGDWEQQHHSARVLSSIAIIRTKVIFFYIICP